MKNIRHFLAIMVAILAMGTTHAESFNTNSSSRSKGPWQIMQTTLYNHYVDTTGLSIISPIDSDLLHTITPDLAKAYQVEEKIDLSHASTLGEVICDFMRVKYAGQSGQTYDYYKYRFSCNMVYDLYLERYPQSPYATEMRLKSECLKQYAAWTNCYDTEDYLGVLLNYESSYCPYGGFTNIALSNNESREQAEYYIYDLSKKNKSYGETYSEDGYGDLFNMGKGLFEDPDDRGALYNLEEEVAILVTPNSYIGHSALCLGNMGKDASIVVSFDGPSTLKVVLGHGQYKWVDLENGEYEVAVTSSNGDVWTPLRNGKVSVENGVYMTSWCNHNGVQLLTDDQYYEDYVDAYANGEMCYSVVKRAVNELSELSELDHETLRGLLMQYIQNSLEPYERNEKELEKYYNELTDDNIDLFISIYQYCLEMLLEEFDSIYQPKNMIKL